MTDVSQRQAHAVLDLPSREHKAEKIARLLGIPAMCGRHHLLEIGTGSGGIAHYFATLREPSFDVDAVDVKDARMVSEGYRFTQVHDTMLPFPDETFDLIISNHVIEHVGKQFQQAQHLEEIHRVLKPGGRAYLAVPNRWMLIEPHYGLLFLSWIPQSWRTPYLRLSGRGEFYDCEPLRKAELERLVSAAQLKYRNASVDAFRATLAIEGDKGVMARLAASVPDSILRFFERVIPTHIYLLEKGLATDGS